jgi:hypothetical protein
VTHVGLAGRRSARALPFPYTAWNRKKPEKLCKVKGFLLYNFGQGYNDIYKLSHWQDIPIPPQTAALPRDSESKIPMFFLMQPPAGRPIDFRLYNPEHKLACATRKLCMVYGDSLGYWFWFIGSVRDVERGVFGDPPLHWSCADYSVQVCPFLISTERQYSRNSGKRLLPVHAVVTGIRPTHERPQELVLMKTNRSKCRPVPGSLIFQVTRHVAGVDRCCDGTPLGPEPR